METNAIIAVLGTVIVTLSGAMVWLVKKDKRESKDREDKFLAIIQQNSLLYEKNLEVLIRIEKLLENWRGH